MYRMLFKFLIRIVIFFYIFLGLLVIEAIANNTDLQPKKPVIVASINPIYQIVLSITKDPQNSHLVINHTLSEHNYQMRPSDVKNINNADLVFYVSDDLETFMAKIAQNTGIKSPRNKFWQLIKIPDLKILPQRTDASKDDIHIWLNPENAIKIATFIAAKITEINPSSAKEYQLNLQEFVKEIKSTSNKIHAQIDQVKNRQFMVYHDGYAYFEDYFGIKEVRAITDYEGQRLTISDLKQINMLIKAKNVKCIFGEPEEEENTGLNIANNAKVKFAILDLIGNKENYGLNKNGYDYILKKVAGDMYDCLSS